jgi:hypothetical protein
MRRGLFIGFVLVTTMAMAQPNTARIIEGPLHEQLNIGTRG